VIPRPRSTRRPDQPTGQQLLRGLSVALGTAAALSILVLANLLPRVYEYREGDVSQVNIKSPKKLTYVSQVRTKAERDRAAASVPEILQVDPNVLAQQRRGLSGLLSSIAAARTTTPRPETRREAIRPLANPAFTDGEAQLLASMDDYRAAQVFQESQRLLLETMRERISDARAQELIRQLPSMVVEQLNEAERSLAVSLTGRFIRSNLAVNQEETARAQAEARDSVAPVSVSVESGEIVLREGQVVSAADLEKLEMLGLRNPTIDWRTASASVLLVSILVAALAGYVYTFHAPLLGKDRSLLLLSSVLVVVVLAAKLVLPARPMWVYVFPLPAVAMLLSTLLDARLSIFMSVLLSILVAQVGGWSLEYAVMFFVACTAAAISVWRRERGQAFFVAGVLAFLAQVAAVAAFQLAGRGDDWQQLMIVGFECLVNGVGSAILAAGGGMLIGRVFGITTTWQLLELANPTHPLLRRLMNEAPGTYHHSLIVGNLAERSAEEVGADPLLARVASYYHDVGKLRRPYFFVENQVDGVNPHDTLPPVESARIICAHVTDGVELALRYGLPARVREMIPQHHGTRLVSFFYQEAQQNGDDDARVEDFTYPGPRPQSKEAAIVMLADSCEAATRAQREHSPEAIDALVEKIILQRVAEGELDDSDLTLRDLRRIKASFCALLIGMYHPRIEYPERREPVAVRPQNGEQLPAPLRNGASHEDAPVASR
jgi:cyclic-di-AMP phosphodiesterase PgpH